MSEAFDPQQNLVVVSARIFGPLRSCVLRLAVDTGATSTVINEGALAFVGYDLTATHNRARVATGSGVEEAAVMQLVRLEALGQHCEDFTALCHSLPVSARLDGVLGLNFLRGRILTVDFKDGRIDLTD